MTELTDERIPAAQAPRVVPIKQQSAYWIETTQGYRIDLMNPDPALINIQDIAWSLSRLARFNGHTRFFEMLSVASHSLWVSMYIWDQTASPLFSLYGLLHDAHEAFIGDIPTPVKQLPGVREKLAIVEDRLQGAVFKAFDLRQPCGEAQRLVKEADAQALAMEARYHLFTAGKRWNLQEPNATAKRIGVIKPCRPMMAFDSFVTTFNIYQTRLAGQH